MAKNGIERSIKGTFSVIKRTFKANYVNTKISYFIDPCRSEPLEVVILLNLTLKRGPILIQHDFLELMDMSSQNSSCSQAVSMSCSSLADCVHNICANCELHLHMSSSMTLMTESSVQSRLC